MALIQCDFYSEVLQLSTSMTVILPQPAPARYPVLYLLHGLPDDHTTWLRRTSIERYVCCGTEDFLYDQNLRFSDQAIELGPDLTYEEGPGEHEWGYWDRMIQRVLAWLPLISA